jgi:DNA-binding protein YbaB
MERKSMTLQKMFNNAQEVEENIQACKQIQNELDAKEHDNEYEQITIDLNLEKRLNDFRCPLEALNTDDFAQDYIPLIEKEGTNLASDASHDNHGVNCFMYSFVDNQENEFANQLVEEQVDVPSFFLLDDIADVVYLSLYDEYDDDYDVDFLEQPAT